MNRVQDSVRRWWLHADKYDWFSGYLKRRRLLGFARIVMASASIGLAAIPSMMLLSEVPPEGSFRISLAVLACVLALAGSAMFIARWPSRSQSIAFALTANAGITLACLAQSNSDAAIHACTAFAVLAGYIAVFHNTPLMIYNFAVAVVVSGVVATELAQKVGIIAAGGAFGVIAVANLAAPFSIQIVVRALGADVLRGDYDPLTGLLCRRAFYRNVQDLVVEPPRRGSLLCMVMIDLDRFKQLNDEHGHSHGDDALAAVGAALRRCCAASAILGRVGGEEFLVADVMNEATAERFGECIRDEIALLPHPITASVGTATLAPDRFPRAAADPERVIATVAAVADAAMYEAKQNGGNRTCIRAVVESLG